MCLPLNEKSKLVLILVFQQKQIVKSLHIAIEYFKISIINFLHRFQVILMIK